MTDVFLWPVPSDANAADVRLRNPTSGGGFPVQFAGLRVWYGAAMHELCLVAAADGATGMGGIPMVDKNGTVYAEYLVETSDPNASSVRIQTTSGVKAIRLKT